MAAVEATGDYDYQRMLQTVMRRQEEELKAQVAQLGRANNGLRVAFENQARKVADVKESQERTRGEL